MKLVQFNSAGTNSQAQMNHAFPRNGRVLGFDARLVCLSWNGTGLLRQTKVIACGRCSKIFLLLEAHAYKPFWTVLYRQNRFFTMREAPRETLSVEQLEKRSVKEQT